MAVQAQYPSNLLFLNRLITYTSFSSLLSFSYIHILILNLLFLTPGTTAKNSFSIHSNINNNNTVPF